MTRATVVTFDLSTIASIRELHELMAKTLHFPEWYGPNWDAFWDVIIGLVPMPDKLRLIGWDDFAQRFPRDAFIMKKCLTELAEEYPANASDLDYL